jgi:hypothetical protein
LGVYGVKMINNKYKSKFFDLPYIERQLIVVTDATIADTTKKPASNRA